MVAADHRAPATRPPRGAVPSTARGDAKREKILDAAAQVLAHTGYAGATLAEIAALAGTHAGSLYYYFAGRDELVTEVLVRGVSRIHAFVAAQLEAAAAQSPPAASDERLRVAVRAHIEFMLERSNDALASVRAIGQVPEVIQRQVLEHQRDYGRLFARLIEQAAAEGHIDRGVDLTAARMLIVGAANWTAEWFHGDGTADAEQVAELLSRMIFTGLGPYRTV